MRWFLVLLLLVWVVHAIDFTPNLEERAELVKQMKALDAFVADNNKWAADMQVDVLALMAKLREMPDSSAVRMELDMLESLLEK